MYTFTYDENVKKGAINIRVKLLFVN